MTTTQQPRKSVATYVANYGSSAAQVQSLADRGTDIDFATRLMLAGAGMDAIFAHHRGSDTDPVVIHAIDEAAEILAEPEVPAFQPNAVLFAAGNIIRVRGWHKGDYRSDTSGAVCALGAIHDAVYGSGGNRVFSPDPRERDAAAELLNRIAIETGEPHSVPSWNDSRTSVDEVVRLMY